MNNFDVEDIKNEDDKYCMLCNAKKGYKDVQTFKISINTDVNSSTNLMFCHAHLRELATSITKELRSIIR